MQFSLVTTLSLTLLAALMTACSSAPKSGSPSRDAQPRSDSPVTKPVPSPTVQTPAPPAVPPPAPPTAESTDKSLDKILADYTQKWQRDYPKRVDLAAKKCPSTRSYNYGMRMLQPATFQGDFLESVQRKYGKSTDFIVIAVAENSAASKAGIVLGDRITQVGSISSTQPSPGPKLAEQSRRWSKPYDVVISRGGKSQIVKLTPDRICDVPL